MYTSHGHHIQGTDQEPHQGRAVARCGGPGLCAKCSQEASRVEEHLIQRIERIRKGADDLARLLDEFTPNSREASLAKTHLEETVMWAVKSIVLPRN